MLKRLAIIAALLLGLHALVRADVASGWIRIETENFEFVGNADEAAMRNIAVRLERFRTALAKVMIVRDPASRTRVIVFKDSASFLAFKPLKPDGTPDERVLGLFVAGEDFNTIAVAADKLDLGTIYHEYVHDVVASSFGTARIPPWLNEGLASYFQAFQMPDHKTATFGSPRPAYQALLRGSPLIPWSEFFALDNFTLHQDAANVRPIFYAQAWALNSYRVNRPLTKILEPESIIAEIEKIERSKLDEAVVLAGSASALYRVEIPTETPIAGAPKQEVTAAAANTIIGDLLYRQRNSRAESFLKRSIELDPKHSAAYVTLGQLRLRDRQFADAKGLLEKAISLDSQSHSAHFTYAFLLLRENFDDAARLRPLEPEAAAGIRRALNRAIGLNPKFAEAQYLLGTVEFSSGNLTVAESAARRAMQLKPGNQNYSLLLAQVLLGQEKADEATRIAGPLVSKPVDARVKADAQAILKDAGELLKAKNALTGPQEIHLAGYRRPTIVKYSDLTPEQVAKIDRDREIYNYNVLIDRPAIGESHTIGYIDRIDCIDERIEFRIKSGERRLSLSTKRFDDIRFRVIVPGTRSFAFRCGARLPEDLAVIVFKPGASQTTGELRGITFVPKDFEYLSPNELLASTHYVIEGRPAQDISQNEVIALKEREEMLREMRETQIRDIEERLRQPEPGEEPVTGVAEKLMCEGGRMSISFKTGDTMRVFSTAITKPFDVQSFNPEAQMVEVGCRAQLPSVSAVITYRKADNELVSVEFVPAWFKLR